MTRSQNNLIISKSDVRVQFWILNERGIKCLSDFFGEIKNMLSEELSDTVFPVLNAIW